MPKKVLEPVSGPQKVAAFLLSLERPVAASLLKTLDSKVVAEVAAAMTRLDPRLCESGAVDDLYKRVSRSINVPLGPRTQDDAELADILEAGLGRDKAKAVLTQIHERRRIERPFATLEREPMPVLAAALADESNAVSALILAHLDPEDSAEILSTLAPDRALEIVKRIATVAPPGTDVLLTVAESLRLRCAEVAKRPRTVEPEVRLKTVAQMLTFTAEAVEKAVLEGLTTSDEATAIRVKEFMFTWNDLAAVDKRGMQKILGSIETRTLAVALKGCPVEVEKNVMDNLSVRVRAMVADERELAGPMPMSQIGDARNEILKSVRALMEAGDFKPARAGEDLVE